MKIEKLLQNLEMKKYFLLLALIILSVLIIIKTQKILIFLALTLISGIICFLNYSTKLPFDITPIFFLSILITNMYGFGYTVLFVILSGLIPSVISGGEASMDSFMYLGVNLLVNLLSIQFLGNNIVFGGIILSVVYSILVGIGSCITGGVIQKEIFSVVLAIIVNVLYFSKLAVVIITFLG